MVNVLSPDRLIYALYTNCKQVSVIIVIFYNTKTNPKHSEFSQRFLELMMTLKKRKAQKVCTHPYECTEQILENKPRNLFCYFSSIPEIFCGTRGYLVLEKLVFSVFLWESST